MYLFVYLLGKTSTLSGRSSLGAYEWFPEFQIRRRRRKKHCNYVVSELHVKITLFWRCDVKDARNTFIRQKDVVLPMSSPIATHYRQPFSIMYILFFSMWL